MEWLICMKSMRGYFIENLNDRGQHGLCLTLSQIFRSHLWIEIKGLLRKSKKFAETVVHRSKRTGLREKFFVVFQFLDFFLRMILLSYRSKFSFSRKASVSGVVPLQTLSVCFAWHWWQEGLELGPVMITLPGCWVYKSLSNINNSLKQV